MNPDRVLTVNEYYDDNSRQGGLGRRVDRGGTSREVRVGPKAASILSPSPEQQGNVYRPPRARIISIHLRIHPIRPRDWTLANLLQTPLVVDIGSRRIRPE